MTENLPPVTENLSRTPEDLKLWNAAVSTRPVAVRRCEDTAQAVAAVRAARSAGLPLSVLGGGHDWAGRAVRERGLVVDLGGTRQVTVDGDVASVGGGATALDLLTAAGAAGWSAATGTVGAVGMAGLTLGGGYGPLSGIAGLAADNLLEAEVVFADGTVGTAREAGDSDLLWALRGGGGNFGVVTSMRIRLHRHPLVYTGMLAFPLAHALDVLPGLAELIASAPDELTVQVVVISSPAGGPVLAARPTWSGPEDEGAQWFKRIEALGKPVMSVAGSVEFAAPLRQGDEMFARDGRHYATRTCNLAALTPEAIAAIVTVGTDRTSPFSAISLHHFHGAATRVPLESSAFGIRREHFMAEIIASWRPSAETHETAHTQWADTAAERLAPHALPGGYPNLLAPGHTEQAAHAYGPNAARLLALKDVYDPDHVFSATPLPPRG
jgi:FAD/FMN-containing dehydrogenase